MKRPRPDSICKPYVKPNVYPLCFKYVNHLKKLFCNYQNGSRRYHQWLIEAQCNAEFYVSRKRAEMVDLGALQSSSAPIYTRSLYSLIACSSVHYYSAVNRALSIGLSEQIGYARSLKISVHYRVVVHQVTGYHYYLTVHQDCHF